VLITVPELKLRSYLRCVYIYTHIYIYIYIYIYMGVTCVLVSGCVSLLSIARFLGFENLCIDANRK